MRNQSNKIAITPRSAGIVPVSPCVLYKLHEATGGTVSDALGNGPNMTLAAHGTGTPWSDTGWITPDGTNHYVNVATSAYLQALMRFDQDYGHIIVAFDYQFAVNTTVVETFFSIGKNATANGMFSIQQSTAEQLQIVARGDNAASATTYSIVGSALTGLVDQRLSLLFEFVKTGANTFDTNVYKNGVAFASHTGADWAAVANGLPWGADEGDGYTFGARNGAAGKDQLVGATSGTATAGKYGRFLMMRRDTRDAAFTADLALELYQYKGEIPRCLHGK